LVEAGALYERILARAPGDFEATQLLGVIALQEGRWDQAEGLLTAALAVQPQHGAVRSNLGMVYLRSGRLDAAREQFELAVKQEPVSVGALLNLGSVLRQLRRSGEALEPLRRAFVMDPASAEIGNLLGACLLDADDAAAAAVVLAQVTRHDPACADGWANLSVALSALGEIERAAECAARAVSLRPDSCSALAALAGVQLRLGRREEAIATYGEAVLCPDASGPTHCAFALALMGNHQVDEAIDQLRLALAADGENLMARWSLTMAQCKPILDDAAAIEASREAFASELTSLERWFDSAERPDAFVAVGSLQPFYLAYQDFDNRELLTRYGRLSARAMQTFPEAKGIAREQTAQRGERGPARRKLRVGILAAHVRSHAVWVAVTKGLVKNLDRDRFDVQLFQLDPESDAETEWAKAQVDAFHSHPRDLATWVAAIRAASLDVAIFPEIGIDPLALQLAALRVAPVQATTWGHPQTSGLPTMDLYFSAAAFEPPGAEAHYSERLVRLPKLGAWFEPWTLKTVNADLASLGIAADEPLLLCPGMPFKYSPVHDRLWARIAKGLRRAGGGRLLFFLGNPEDMHQRLVLRLRRAFREERLNFDKEVYLLPFIARSRFFGVMRESALMLDTLGFSGFNTALHGIEAGLPVLAREGRFLRGRLASGILRQLDLPELVAVSDEEFIEKAIQLTGDVKKRESFRREIEQRRGRLFNDLEPIRAFERCLLESCGRS
jgi:predicted O-linked N-acetylglucosamine transferase (SPINDLY family)